MERLFKMTTKITKEQITEVKKKIEDFEYVKNGMHRINNSSVDVRNVRIRGDKALADVYLIFEERTENYPDEEYNLNLLDARE